jgi:hypothetical protein
VSPVQFAGVDQRVNSARISEPPGKQRTALETSADLSGWEAFPA